MNAPFYIISDNHFMMDDTPSEQIRRNKLFEVIQKNALKISEI